MYEPCANSTTHNAHWIEFYFVNYKMRFYFYVCARTQRDRIFIEDRRARNLVNSFVRRVNNSIMYCGSMRKENKNYRYKRFCDSREKLRFFFRSLEPGLRVKSFSKLVLGDRTAACNNNTYCGLRVKLCSKTLKSPCWR